ncbi:hypothetical protein GCM10023116_46580 [Kistimonas scapharcae]|uniref:Uncharacterized protein n=1 Tax=Kistimonas scapharcae TaxID=1036133 RepID=A0ABP8V8T1_9GAMM
MRNRSDPGQVIPLQQCVECQGEGEVKQIFSRWLCNTCNGLGMVDKATGKALEPDTVIRQLLIRLRHAREQGRTLQQELAKARTFIEQYNALQKGRDKRHNRPELKQP